MQQMKGMVYKVIRLSNIKAKPNHTKKDLYKTAAKKLSVRPEDIKEVSIVKRSLDARHKPDIFYIYTIDVLLKKSGSEAAIIKRNKNVSISYPDDEKYTFPFNRNDFASVKHKRPVIIGFGPAGMFAALMLAGCGLRPVIIERGQCVEDRKKTVEHFWRTNELDIQSNVQFGEGGAGTFSDGKLNTSVKDAAYRMKAVLNTFVEFGADSSVLYVNKPHIGTDILYNIVKNIRSRIISLGGEIKFNTCFEDFEKTGRQISAVTVRDTQTDSVYKIETDCVILAVGHSARDTFKMLYNRSVNMIPKAFAVGLRIEHPQKLINMNAYGSTEYALPAADYKLTNQTDSGRGVYSFCMCPGGYVVNASSENEMTAINGMSYSSRSGNNANSAIIVTVNPQDYAVYSADSCINPLSGIEFQRHLERAAYKCGRKGIPIQLAADFKANRASTGLGCVIPQIKGAYQLSNIREMLPAFIGDSIAESMAVFERYIHGFDMDEAVFSGVESRTSSPLRIIRDNDTYESNIGGLYPCGEGAGYAGGITSAAMDGIRAAEKAASGILNKCGTSDNK